MHRRGVADDLRTANLLGALSLTLAERAGAAIAGGTEVAGTDAAALVTLHNYAEGEPLEVLRRALGLSQPGTVRLVDRLERRGLVVRGRGSDDARTVGARLTGAGRDAAVRILAARAEFLTQALGALDEHERETLDALLAKLLAAGTTDRTSARWICRLCDGDACGHPDRCPVTQAVH